MKMKAVLKFVALVSALFVTLFLVAQLIHALDQRSHQTHSSTEQPRSRLTATSPSSSARSYGQQTRSSLTGTAAASTSANSALFVGAAPHASPLSSSTGSAAPRLTAASFEAATAFTTLAVDDDQYISLLPNSTEAPPDEEESEDEEQSEEQQAADDGRLSYSTADGLAFTAASAPSRPLCRALAGKVSSTVEYGAEDSGDDDHEQQATNHDLRLSLKLDNVEATVDRADLHVRVDSSEHERCYDTGLSSTERYNRQPQHQQAVLDFDSADEQHGLSRAELTYRMVAHQHGVQRGQQHWEKLVNFLGGQNSSHCVQVAFTLHQRALACTTPYQPLQLPAVRLEGEERREGGATGWEKGKETVQHDIVSLIGSLASLVSSAAIGLAAAPTTAVPARSPESSIPPSYRPASPCSNLSFTATTRLVNGTRVHLLYTPHYHHPAIRRVEALLRNVSGGPLLFLHSYRMSRVPQTHMPVYRAVLRLGWATSRREVKFDYLFRVTLKRGHVTCVVPGGHFSSNSSRSSAHLSPSQSSSFPPTLPERCPITDVFNVSAKIIRTTAVQASSSSTNSTYKLVLTSHVLQLDWVHVHLFVNASQPTAITEGRYRTTRALTAPDSTQQQLSSGAVRWEHVMDGVADERAGVEYAFTYRFNGSSSCDTTARASTIERLLMGEESVEPGEQVKSLFDVLGAEESEQWREEQQSTVDELMDTAQREDGVQLLDDVGSEDQATRVSAVDEQMDTLAAAGASSASPNTLQQSPQAVSVSIDAMGNVVPSSIPYDVARYAGIGPVVPPPYHQYQYQLHQPPMHPAASLTASSATAAVHALPSPDVHVTAEQQAAAMGGGSTDEQMHELDASGCAGGDYMCHIAGMCHPCIGRPQGEFCASCSQLYNCPTQQCVHAAVRLFTHSQHCLTYRSSYNSS